MFFTRKATIQDIPEIENLMELSIANVLGGLLDTDQLEAA